MTALVGGVLAGLPVGAPPANAASAATDSTVGLAPDTAAGSCWEIKQRRPAAADGAYWLLTPRMAEPAQFYCDMTTDGGGWVLIGKGRDGWTSDYDGKGNAAALLTPDTTPMGPATHQLPSRTVDELLNGGRVADLAEGVRIRRARNATGTQWQEVRMRFARLASWSWTFGAENPLASYSIDTLDRTGGRSDSFGIDSAYNRVDNTTDDDKAFRRGFAYGSLVTGQPTDSSYLWAPDPNGGEAIPYATVYLRPRVTSADAGFTAIGDSGTAQFRMPQSLRSDALVTPWGVAGLAGTTATEGDVEVQAFTQSGNRMYVGGNFRYVQRDASGAGRVEQPFLAAFDVDTGEWVSSFRPQLNEQVSALATLPDGTVVAGGLFSQANGRPAGAIVGLDPTTGATRESFNLHAERRPNGGPRIRTLDVQDGWIYVGGAFTHLVGGPNDRARYTRNLGRASVTDGLPSFPWNPDLNGTVLSVDASEDGDRVYASGHFGQAGGLPAYRAVVLSTADEAPIAEPSWQPTWSSSRNNYQRAIAEVGDRVYVGGSEHSLFGFSNTTFERLSGSITKAHGDIQAIGADDDLLYAGCHCSDWSYDNAFTWPRLNSDWTVAHAMSWFGVWESATGDRVPSFTPNFRMRLGSGIWALTTDSNGVVWAGGDIETVRTTQGQRFSGGFARFQRTDTTPPGQPSGLRVVASSDTEVTLAWNTVGPDESGVRYQVLRDDRPIGSTTGNVGTITVPRGGEDRYFVRAADRAGNHSASTTVLELGAPPANTPPEATFTAQMEGLDGTFDASGSSDAEGEIVDYAWSFGDGGTGSGEVVQHSYAAAGDYTVELVVTDEAGATHSTTQQVTATEPSGGSVEQTVVARDAEWSWYFGSAAPPATWNQRSFDASSWDTGAAPLGWGHAGIETDIDSFADPTDRPRAAYFTRELQIADASEVTALELESIADDGVVVYVNGTEVGRHNMRDGEVTHTTYAPTARRYGAASTDPVVIDVPTSLLVDGRNVISAETHVNYRRTPDLTFFLEATMTTSGDQAGDTAPEPSTSVAVAQDADWSWYFGTAAPPATWNQPSFDASSWSIGGAPLGWGSAAIETDIDSFADPTDRARAAYFVRDFTVSDASDVTQLVLESIADDGVVIYVNGTEVGRHNMRDGEVTHTTYAPTARRYGAASSDPVVIEVPTSLLVDGRNVIAAETHVNYRRTPDLTFFLEATMTVG